MVKKITVGIVALIINIAVFYMFWIKLVYNYGEGTPYQFVTTLFWALLAVLILVSIFFKKEKKEEQRRRTNIELSHSTLNERKHYED